MCTSVTTTDEYGKDEHRVAKRMTLLIRYFKSNLEIKRATARRSLSLYFHSPLYK